MEGSRRSQNLSLSADWPNALVAGAFLLYGIAAFVSSTGRAGRDAFGLGLAGVALSLVPAATLATKRRWPTITVGVFSLAIGVLGVFGSISNQLALGFDAVLTFTGMLALAFATGGALMLRRTKPARRGDLIGSAVGCPVELVGGVVEAHGWDGVRQVR